MAVSKVGTKIVRRSSGLHLIEGLEQRTLLSAGSLDTSFSGDGKLTSSLSGSGSPAIAIAGNGHAKIVVLTQVGNGIVVARYTPSGGWDNSFGTGGEAIISTLTQTYEPRCMALQSDNSVIVGGHYQSGSTSEAFLLRLTANGTLDSTFGTHGIKLFHFGSFDRVDSIAVLSSGKILAATNGFDFEDSVFLAEQFKSNGSVDTSFGKSGIGMADFGPNETDVLTNILVQSTGKIILGGEYGNTNVGPRLARLNANGFVDSSFHQGSDTFNQSVDGIKVALEYNDKIIVTGGLNITGKAFVVERYTANGSIDKAFNGTGHAVATFGKLSAIANGVVVQPNGSIVVAGTVGGNMEVLRFLSTGVADSSFGASGRSIIQFSSTSTGNAVALESSGRILVAGSKGKSLAVVRLLGDHTVLSAGQSMVTTGTTAVDDPSLLNETFVAEEEPIFSFGSGSSKVSGGVTELVLKEAGTNTLDFYYQVGINAGSAGSITSMTLSNFAGFTTYVDYRSDSSGGTIAPVTASRSGDSKSITFNFVATPTGNGVVGASETSYSLLIKTNALHYQNENGDTLNGVQTVGAFAPIT